MSKFGEWIIRRATRRPPDFIVGGKDRPYLLRWWLIPRNRIFNVYLHQFLRDDDDRALHDHPWAWCSILLRGQYMEHTIAAGGIHRRERRRPGSVKLSLPSKAHRVELLKVRRVEFVDGPSGNPGIWDSRTGQRIEFIATYHGDHDESWLLLRDGDGNELERRNARFVERIVWEEPKP